MQVVVYPIRKNRLWPRAGLCMDSRKWQHAPSLPIRAHRLTQWLNIDGQRARDLHLPQDKGGGRRLDNLQPQKLMHDKLF